MGIWSKQKKGSPEQRGALWLSILLATTYLITTMTLTGWTTSYAYTECPADAKGMCVNTLYDCQHNAKTYDMISWDYSCADPKKGQKICLEHPELCEQRHISPGTILGDKPPLAVRIMPGIISATLILGAIAYILLGRKENTKHAK